MADAPTDSIHHLQDFAQRPKLVKTLPSPRKSAKKKPCLATRRSAVWMMIKIMLAMWLVGSKRNAISNPNTSEKAKADAQKKLDTLESKQT
ncbi:hypothetical protein LSUE1_G007626 [Lachnellula suecica]|uniref:Uncharacterized protein n=1 Tax=Lachnellula suecica TaxID=602035 RepID=A0A8T9BXL7_9HELO|nr:hypothetical protein LSUE1_G007626 [Lachnellula suecica]